jgi:hypothetical protein
MNNKRKFERFNIDVPAMVEIPSQDGQAERLDLEISNMSAEGILLKFARPLPEGSQVKIEVVLHFEELRGPADPEDTLILTATGHVLRSGPEGMAIRFDENYEITSRLDDMQKENSE